MESMSRATSSGRLISPVTTPCGASINRYAARPPGRAMIFEESQRSNQVFVIRGDE